MRQPQPAAFTVDQLVAIFDSVETREDYLAADRACESAQHTRQRRRTRPRKSLPWSRPPRPRSDMARAEVRGLRRIGFPRHARKVAAATPVPAPKCKRKGGTP